MSRLYGFRETTLETECGGEFEGLVNTTMELRKMMYGDYVSGDVEVFSPPPGSKFDPVKMEVDDPRGKTQKAVTGLIACTTTIGIVRVDKEKHDVLSRAQVLMKF
jgi:hypothetical protein